MLTDAHAHVGVERILVEHFVVPREFGGVIGLSHAA
jgi:hypothetical protein